MIDNSSEIRITHYRAPAIEGTHIYFNCPGGLLLSGPNSSTCMGNGEWEPAPQEVECKGDNNVHTLKLITINWHCIILIMLVL